MSTYNTASTNFVGQTYRERAPLIASDVPCSPMIECGRFSVVNTDHAGKLRQLISFGVAPTATHQLPVTITTHASFHDRRPRIAPYSVMSVSAAASAITKQNCMTHLVFSIHDSFFVLDSATKTAIMFTTCNAVSGTRKKAD